MDSENFIELQNTVIEFLKENNVGTVPEALLGFNRYPEFNSEQHRKFMEVQSELFNKNLVVKQSNSLNGFVNLNLTPKGYTIKFENEIQKKEQHLEKIFQAIYIEQDEITQRKKIEDERQRKLDDIEIARQINLKINNNIKERKERTVKLKIKVVKALKLIGVIIGGLVAFIGGILAISDSETFKKLFEHFT